MSLQHAQLTIGQQVEGLFGDLPADGGRSASAHSSSTGKSEARVEVEQLAARAAGQRLAKLRPERAG